MFCGNTVLNISINPPSVTPTAPGDGIPDTVPYKTDCILIIFNIFSPFSPNEQYTQYDTLYNAKNSMYVVIIIFNITNLLFFI